MRIKQQVWPLHYPSTVAWVAVVVLVSGGGAHAQPAALETSAIVTNVPDIVSIDTVKARIEALEASTNLAEAVRDSALALFRAAQSQLETAAKHEQAASAFTAAIDSSPAALEEVRKALQVPVEEQRAAVLRDATVYAELPELEQRLVKSQAAEAAAAGGLRDLHKQEEIARERPNQIRERLSMLRRQLDELEQSMKTIAPEPPNIQEARRALLASQHRAVLAETHMLEQEHLGYDVRNQLLSARVNLGTRKLSLAQARRAAVQEQVSGSRRVEAENTRIEADQARIEAIGKHPLVARAAEVNSEISDELAEMVARRAQFSDKLVGTAKLSEEIDHDFRVARQRLEIAGLSEALGMALSEVRGELPDLDAYRKAVAERQPILTAIGLGQLRIAENRRRLGDVEQSINQIMEQETDSSLSKEQESEIRGELQKLLEGRHLLLDKLETTYSENLRALGELDFDQQQLVDKAQEFAEFLDQRLLWIPNTSIIGLGTLKDLGPALGYFLAPANWGAVIKAIVVETSHVPARTIFALLVFIALLAMRHRLHVRLLELGRRVGYPYADGFSVTLQALAITFLLTIIWPVILGFVGRRLQIAQDVPVFVNGVGSGLMEVAGVLLFFFGFRVFCCKGGAALDHFRWPDDDVRLLRRNLRWLLLIVTPAVLVTVTLAAQPEKAHINSLGRLAYIVIVVSLGIFLQRVLNPRSGVMAKAVKEKQHTWLVRLRHVWYALAVGAPLGLAVLAALGYFYSAAFLTQPVYFTVWMFVAAKILNDLVVRWLVVNQSRMEWEKTLEADAARAKSSEGGAETTGEGGTVSGIEYAELDMTTINEQTRRLLNAAISVGLVIGVLLIWSEVVPALGILDDVVLWEHAAMVDGQETMEAITLVDLGLAVFVGVLILVSARNLPGLLEIVLLQRLPLDAGLRYAITTISQYTIVAVGVILVFGTIGVGWSEVQWLAAALTVGLGFGLQEIFANFMSGLIILFERPVRIGDTVTIGNLTGTVSRIRIRATTITDWDNKEIVVPNKTFITDQLINWTLSDPIVRVVMKIGIAYGSDTTLAHRVMLDTARSNPMVMTDPAATVYFVGLGDSSLDFDVRVYVKDMGDWLPVMHEFHMAIVNVLSENGIEIPFPQRDIHVRSVQALAGSQLNERLQGVGGA